MTPVCAKLQLSQGAQRLHPHDSPHDARQCLPYAGAGASVRRGARHVPRDASNLQDPAAAAAAAAGL